MALPLPLARGVASARFLLAAAGVEAAEAAEHGGAQQPSDCLRSAGVQVLTLGQYLRPTPQHLPVVEYIHPETFSLYSEIARRKGFEFVASGPLVRSSYHAADFNPVARKD